MVLNTGFKYDPHTDKREKPVMPRNVCTRGIRSRSQHSNRDSSQEMLDENNSIRSVGNRSRSSRPEVLRSHRGSKERRSESRRPDRRSEARDKENILPDGQEPQRRRRSRSASQEGLGPSEDILPTPSKNFYRGRLKELRGWMTSQLESAENKRNKEDFVPSFDSIYRYLSRGKGEIAHGTFKLLDVSRPLLYL